MKLIKMGAAVLNQTPLAWQHNQRNIITAIDRAREDGVTILCLPEMCITGYSCEDAFHSPGLQQKAIESLLAIAAHTRGMIVSVGLPLQKQKALYNCAGLLVDGEIAGFVGKRFLAGDGVHYEPRWFKPWPAGKRSTIDIGGRAYPLGDISFECGPVRIGFEICEDAWVANRPGSALSMSGVDVILNPSASHFAFRKFAVRQRFVIEGSRAFGVAYVYANLLGNEAGRVIFDGGALIATTGSLVARGPRFSFADVVVTSAVVDVDANRVEQVRRSSHQPAYDDAQSCIAVPFTFPPLLPTAADVHADLHTCDAQPSAAWEDSPHREQEEFARALGIGLFDYLRKSRSHGFVVSLSGGADSAAVSVLSALAVKLAEHDQGLELVRERLAYIPGVREAASTSELVRRLLLCVYQATRNSSDITFGAARAVADGLGVELVRFDIDALVEGYVSLAAGAIGRPLTWEQDDITLQNIQARVRGPGVWMLANVRNALLLATSNRSEAAVGYATMDGDTCGGLSPIAGIDKAFLRQWLVWMEHHGPAGIGPIPGLAAVNVQAPTAELRPLASAQTDEGDLMPYPLLDAIEGAAIRDKHTPLEVFLEMRAAFPQYSVMDLGIWVERFFRLWCRNQWKRERYAPSFHLDDENLDPKTWCRFPILSGGFTEELAELRAYIDGLAREAR